MRRRKWLPLLVVGIALSACCCIVLFGATAFVIARFAGEDIQWSWSTSASGSEPEPTPDPVLFARQPTSAERETAERVAEMSLPQRDLIELAQRLGRKSPSSASVQPVAYQLGDRLGFWVHDEETSSYFTTTATLLYFTDHAYWWVEEGYEVSGDDLESSAQNFETETYPTTRRLFGSEPSPGVDGDRHVYVYLGKVPGLGGYFSSIDAFPSYASELSNQHEMFYINLQNAMPGSSYFDGILAHEFQHMIQWAGDRNEDTWLSEGLSELAAQVNGYEGDYADQAYLRQPDTQLTTWPDLEEMSAHYGASYLFSAYFLERFGEKQVRRLADEQANGMAGVDAVLGPSKGTERSSTALFADWAVANYLDDPQVGDRRYSYAGLDVRRPAASAVHTAYPTELQASVHQYGVDYVELEGTGDVTIYFTGSLVVPLVGCQPHSGDYYWWSGRGDDSDAIFTRAFDLTGLEQATLTAWTWYQLETHFDYAYVEASADGGQTWDILANANTTVENPEAASYGPAFTGLSGGGSEPDWVEQTFDLTRYAGEEVLIRFEVIYDAAVNYAGLCLDDLSIAELGYTEGAEQELDGWDARGWVRATGYVPQEFVVQLVTLGSEPRVTRIALDDEKRGSAEVSGLGSDVERAVLVISGVTPTSTAWAGYAYRVVAR